MDYELSSDVEHLSQQDHIQLNNVDTSALPLSSYPTSVSNDVAGTSMILLSSPSSEPKTHMVVNIGGNPNSMQMITTTTSTNARNHILNSSTKSNHSIKSNSAPSNNTTTSFNIFKSHTKANNNTSDGKYKFNLLSNGHQKTKWNQIFIIAIFLIIFGIAIISIVTLTSHLNGIYYCKSDKKGTIKLYEREYELKADQ
jgi:hypothetical protein